MFVQLDYILSFRTPFHFGTGIREGLVDRTVIRDAGGYLYVPASTFKGVLREQCEHLCHFYTAGDQEQKKVSTPHDVWATLAEFGTPTLISQTFGSPLLPGGLLFSDAGQSPQVREMYKGVQTSLFTQVRIDRVTQTAVDEALYTSQFGIRDLIFEGNITGQLGSPVLPDMAQPVMGEDGEVVLLTPTYALLLLLAGLLMIERLGGNKSTGKGECSCTITGLALDRHGCSKEIWREWIEHLDVLADYPRPEKGLPS
jgi:CRISPR/Cas system CMR subunit Cmr4 (Cas7 group RAMP superfamily)